MRTPQQEFWRDPTGIHEGIDPLPEKYQKAARPDFWLPYDAISHYLVGVADLYLDKGDVILEPGCGPGRNLHHFHNAGYKVWGIEINAEAIKLAHEHFPDISNYILHGSVEDGIADSPVADAVVTQGFLMHLAPSDLTEATFSAIAEKATDIIITNESEQPKGLTTIRFAHDYKHIFEIRGFVQIGVLFVDDIQPISGCVTRIFRRL